LSRRSFLPSSLWNSRTLASGRNGITSKCSALHGQDDGVLPDGSDDGRDDSEVVGGALDTNYRGDNDGASDAADSLAVTSRIRLLPVSAM
jgi:hypothetical protein